MQVDLSMHIYAQYRLQLLGPPLLGCLRHHVLVPQSRSNCITNTMTLLSNHRALTFIRSTVQNLEYFLEFHNGGRHHLEFRFKPYMFQ